MNAFTKCTVWTCDMHLAWHFCIPLFSFSMSTSNFDMISIRSAMFYVNYCIGHSDNIWKRATNVLLGKWKKEAVMLISWAGVSNQSPFKKHFVPCLQRFLWGFFLARKQMNWLATKDSLYLCQRLHSLKLPCCVWKSFLRGAQHV